MQLHAQAFPHAVERCVDREVRILAAACAEVAGRVERVPFVVEHEDSVLEQADKIVTELQANLAFLEERVLEQQPAFPAALRLKVSIAPVDAPDRELRIGNEVVEVELRDGAAKDQLGVPPAARLPVERDAGLRERELTVGQGVAAHLEVRHLVMQAEIHPESLVQRPARIDVNLAAKFGHLRIVDRQVDRRLAAVLFDYGKLEIVGERVPRDLAAGLEAEAEQALTSPAQSADGLVALRIR